MSFATRTVVMAVRVVMLLATRQAGVLIFKELIYQAALTNAQAGNNRSNPLLRLVACRRPMCFGRMRLPAIPHDMSCGCYIEVFSMQRQ